MRVNEMRVFTLHEDVGEVKADAARSEPSVENSLLEVGVVERADGIAVVTLCHHED